MASLYSGAFFFGVVEMPQSEITVDLSLKFRWWVKPMLRAAALWYACRLPIDASRFAKWVGRHGSVIKVD